MMYRYMNEYVVCCMNVYCCMSVVCAHVRTTNDYIHVYYLFDIHVRYRYSSTSITHIIKLSLGTLICTTVCTSTSNYVYVHSYIHVHIHTPYHTYMCMYVHSYMT